MRVGLICTNRRLSQFASQRNSRQATAIVVHRVQKRATVVPGKEGYVLVDNRCERGRAAIVSRKIAILMARFIQVGQHSRNDLLGLIAKLFKTSCYSLLPYREVGVGHIN